jgi:hypothetical protein
VTKFLLAVHVLAVIIAVGPVAVAASMFPVAVRGGHSSDHSVPVAGTLHRICRVYATVAVVVPVFGLATAGSLHVLGNAWLITSIVLTVLAAAVLALLVVPGQGAVIAELKGPEPGGTAADISRLAMYTGVFNLLWATVTILMIVRPGSTTGA